jgi:hypothetical protein
VYFDLGGNIKMDDNKNTEAIDEGKLEHVVGGTSDAKDCWFRCTPKNARVELKNGERRMWCNSLACTSGCACHGTTHCVDAWHWMNDDEQSPELLPAAYKNHFVKNQSGLKGRYRDPRAPEPI